MTHNYYPGRFKVTQTVCHRCRDGRIACQFCNGTGFAPGSKSARGGTEPARCSACFGSRTSRCTYCGGAGFIKNAE